MHKIMGCLQVFLHKIMGCFKVFLHKNRGYSIHLKPNQYIYSLQIFTICAKLSFQFQESLSWRHHTQQQTIKANQQNNLR